MKTHAKRETRKSKHRRVGTRFPNIMRHAEELGVNRVHLFKCLTGARISHSLVKRYNELLKEESRHA